MIYLFYNVNEVNPMKRFLSIILTAVILLSGLVFEASAETKILTKPTVFLSGPDEYNIVFATFDYAAAFVEIKHGGKTYVYADEYDGLIRTDDYIHTVRVPKSMLDSAGGYTIIAREVDSNKKGGISYLSELRENYTFYGDKGKNDANISVFSDLHLKPAEYKRAEIAKNIMDNKMGRPDLIVLNGDITDALPNDMYFAEALIEGAHIISQGQIPVIYVRGNHEARGEFAQFIDKYLSFTGGNMYGRVEFGPASFIIGDCGEDKPDYQVEYGGLVDFDNYLASQLNWLENMGGYDNSKPYHIALSHSPKFFDRKYSSECFVALEKYQTDIQISGHHHTAALFSGAKYPIVIDGGAPSDNFKGGLLKLSGDDIHFEAWDKDLNSVFTHDAKTVKKQLSPKSENKKSEYVQNEPLLPIVTTSGIASQKGSNYSPTVTVPPTVFDCGDMYNIVYVADSGSNLTKAQAVVTAKDGKVYTFTDHKSGNAVSNAVHSIAVPKEILEGASYCIKTTYLGAYGAYGENYMYEATATDIGLTVTSKSYTFSEFNEGESVSVASFSKCGGIEAAVNAKNTLSIDPDVIVLGGNMTDGLYTQKDFVNNILIFANTLSGGTKPVIFVRGEGECYGDFAPYLSQILRVSENGSHNGMYFKTRYGDVNIVVCDTYREALSNQYIEKQRAWLESLTFNGGKCTFFVGSNTDALKKITEGVYSSLGGCAYIGDGESYGSINIYDKNTLSAHQNSVYGTKDTVFENIDPKIDEGKLTENTLSTPNFLTDEQKALEVSPDYDEVVTEKPTDLPWHTIMIYEWEERGLSTAPTGEFKAKSMQCTQFLMLYYNLSGVDFDKLGYTVDNKPINRQLCALKLAYKSNLILYEPPIMHTFSADEITQILKSRRDTPNA